jgi:hypothetical protein
MGASVSATGAVSLDQVPLLQCKKLVIPNPAGPPTPHISEEETALTGPAKKPGSVGEERA